VRPRFPYAAFVGESDWAIPYAHCSVVSTTVTVILICIAVCIDSDMAASGAEITPMCTILPANSTAFLLFCVSRYNPRLPRPSISFTLFVSISTVSKRDKVNIIAVQVHLYGESIGRSSYQLISGYLSFPGCFASSRIILACRVYWSQETRQYDEQCYHI